MDKLGTDGVELLHVQISCRCLTAGFGHPCAAAAAVLFPIFSIFFMNLVLRDAWTQTYFSTVWPYSLVLLCTDLSKVIFWGLLRTESHPEQIDSSLITVIVVSV